MSGKNDRKVRKLTKKYATATVQEIMASAMRQSFKIRIKIAFAVLFKIRLKQGINR